MDKCPYCELTLVQTDAVWVEQGQYWVSLKICTTQDCETFPLVVTVRQHAEPTDLGVSANYIREDESN